MEYIVSARKYRPMSFDTVVGQGALTSTLKNAVTSGKLAHAYLFCGPRGVGKTTCARIFAKAINCMTPTANGEACGQCESCLSFAEQRSFNIFELDAASNNSVEDIKTLMEQTHIPPQVGKYKVFIIDEVHMLSQAAFNAFLKTLEEPPAHMVFILATTEKHKLLPTIVSRCQIFDFERMNVQNTINHLKMVAEKEGITYENEALAVIAEKADGGMRDALSIFDQVASFCQGNITYEKVIEDLNVLDADNYFKIVEHSLKNEVTEIMLLLNKVIARGFDAGNVAQGLASHIRNVMMARDPQTMNLLEVSEQQKERYKEQAQHCPTQFLYKALKLLNQCDVNYRQSTNKRLLVELTLIQVAQITQPEDEASASGRSPKMLKILFRLITRPVQETKAASQVAAPETVSVTMATPSATTATPTTENTQAPKPSPRIKLKDIGFTFKQSRESEKRTDTEQENSSVNTQTNTVFDDQQLRTQWLSMCNRIMLKPEMKALASRMKNIKVQITEFPNIDIIIDNDILYKSVAPLQNRIVLTLKKSLYNDNINATFRLAEPGEIKPMLTRPEQFKQLVKNNKQLAQLIEKLKLELC